ncbi:hypothetical protein ACQ4M4_01020 [Leptolyngbya sp. AN02str]|uniref:hypothetical protein n=1 Tax=Leptolyngbya sp. AN02str TaxID=3423363 RepID=UPI003D3229DC
MLETRIRHRKQSNVHSRRTEAQAIAARADMFSARNLDLVSLAVCSCVLTLLCHSVTNLPQASTSLNSKPASQTGSASSGGSIFSAFTVPSSRPQLKEEE